MTTRITKYPLLIEPLIKTAKDRPAEQQRLRNCLSLVKSILVDVNEQVAEKDRAQKLLEIYNKMDARSYVTHEGKKFKKSDILLLPHFCLKLGKDQNCFLTWPKCNESYWNFIQISMHAH